MPPVRLPGVFFNLAASSLLILLIPVISYPHDGKLDEYGCHYDQGPKHYHCHEGVYKFGVFGSKTQMIQRLRLQYLNLGRPWPYSEIGEEDITSTHTQAHEPPKVEPKEIVEAPRKVTTARKKPVPVADQKKAVVQLPKSGESASKRQTASPPAKEAKRPIEPTTAKTQQPATENKNREIQPGESASKRQTASRPTKEAKQQIEPTTAKTQQPVTENKNREIRPIQEWVVKITSDGSVIYENSRRERYYFDRNGKRVDVRNGQ